MVSAFEKIKMKPGVSDAGDASRVDEGSCLPPPPTDPDVRNSRIRLLISWLCCAIYRVINPGSWERVPLQ